MNETSSRTQAAAEELLTSAQELEFSRLYMRALQIKHMATQIRENEDYELGWLFSEVVVDSRPGREGFYFHGRESAPGDLITRGNFASVEDFEIRAIDQQMDRAFSMAAKIFDKREADALAISQAEAAMAQIRIDTAKNFTPEQRKAFGLN